MECVRRSRAGVANLFWRTIPNAILALIAEQPLLDKSGFERLAADAGFLLDEFRLSFSRHESNRNPSPAELRKAAGIASIKRLTRSFVRRQE